MPQGLVDLVGIEPTTSSMPWKRAPSCATGPRGENSLHNSRPPPSVSQTNQSSRIQFGEIRQNEYAESKELSMNKKILIAVFSSVIALAAVSVAQTSAMAQAVSYSSITELNQLLANLQQASQASQLDLARLRIDRWKADAGTKRQTQSDTESINRNLQNALPGMLADLKNSPENLALTFKVYRNLVALYDHFSSVVESTGAFGSKEEFESLNKDLGALEDSRHAFADRVDKLANAKETELGQLRTALQQARTEVAPKKVVVDDTAPPPKKTTPRKKPAAKSTNPPASPAAAPHP